MIMSEEEKLIEAIVASLADEGPRLTYAGWLEGRGDERGSYLRAELEHFRTSTEIRDAPLWALQAKLDPIWVATVSRAPFGILVAGLTLSDSGPKGNRSDLKTIESHWQQALPPDYAAFLLCYNGGRPSMPYLYSYADSREDSEDYYDEVFFFSTVDKHPNGQPYLMMSVVEAFQGHIAPGQDERRLRRMMPLGTVTRDDDSECMLALVMENMDNDEVPIRIVDVEYWQHHGLSVASDDVHWKDSFVGLLMDLCDRPES
jgi:uncharacterized protein (TIGR02996 family)